MWIKIFATFGIEHGNRLHTVTVIMQVTKKQGEVFMDILYIFVVCLLHGEAKA